MTIHREKVSGDVTVLRLDHGPVSALDTEILDELRAQLADLAAQGSAVVVTGTGRAFSAGVDLPRLLRDGVEYVERFIPTLSGAFDDLFRYPRPLVVAANGHAIAGGCVIVCTGDHRLMAEGGGRIGVPELLVGVPFPAIALEAVRFAIGDRRIQEMVYTGATWPPAEAAARGLVDEVVPASELVERAVDRAEQLAAFPPDAFWHTKWALRGPVVERVRRDPSRDAQMLALWMSPTTSEAISAYVERTFGSRRAT